MAKAASAKINISESSGENESMKHRKHQQQRGNNQRHNGVAS